MQTKSKIFLIVFIIIGSLASCSKKTYLRKIETYLNASTPDLKSKYMADDYRSFFMEIKGNGEDKGSSLKSFQQWDAPLHPDIQILHFTVIKDSWTISLNEKNDFTKLIDFPGWKATLVITFNAAGLIKESVYIPDSTNPNYKKWLQPAIDWLQEHMPAELNEVYRNSKLIETEVTAKKWVGLLQRWRGHTKQ